MQRFFCLLLFLSGGSPLWTQVCTGNLGENIFTEGDFGSGEANVIVRDPEIAPGFRYTPSPPPNDGFYLITNDMRRWPRIFPAWEAFADNSDDPQGYMMVVNAAFSPGLFYEQEIDGLCENTLYQFTADIRNILRPGSNALQPSVSFLLDGAEAFATGSIGETGSWQTYGFTFTTAPGQTTLTLALRNNAPGGNGNDLALDNIAFRPCGPEAFIAGEERLRVCEDRQAEQTTFTATINGEQYDDPALQWQQSFDGGITWGDMPGQTDPVLVFTERAAGFYYFRFLLANGSSNLANTKCRIVSNLKVVEVTPKRVEVTDTICSGLSVTIGSSTYNSTGVSVDSLISTLGCDSIVTLRLTVAPDPGLQPDFSLAPPSCDYTRDGAVELVNVGPTPFRGPFTYQLDTFPEAGIGGVATGLGEGRYAYEITDRFGCMTTGAVELVSPNPFTFELGPDQQIVLGERLRLPGLTSDIVEYAFSPPGVVDCTTDCLSEQLLLTENTDLQLTGTSAAGCIYTDSLRILVIKERLVYPPTAFSPNGDGVNDQFTLFGGTPNVTQIVQLDIFDRWGGQVFSRSNLMANDTGAGWDGLVDGVEGSSGTYFYQAEVLFLDGVVLPFSGEFVLLR